jgi:hypothetical protein
MAYSLRPTLLELSERPAAGSQSSSKRLRFADYYTLKLRRASAGVTGLAACLYQLLGEPVSFRNTIGHELNY